MLVVEDNDKSMKLFRALLDLRGARTIAARTVRDGLAAARAECPDVIVLDVHLPDGTGTAMLAELRRHAATASVPVVAVTAYAMAGDRERLLAAGFDAYIAKPIDASRFADEVLDLVPVGGGDG